MNELDDIWTRAMLAAEQQAKSNARSDVADYLRLREANDDARRGGIDWLLGIFLQVAAEANRRGMSLFVERSDAHSFPVGTATMQGTQLRLKIGIRSLTVEAGFPRLPKDGFIRGNGLACARITHFGIASANEDLILARADNKQEPAWMTIDKNGFRQPFQISRLKHHFATFFGQL